MGDLTADFPFLINFALSMFLIYFTLFSFTVFQQYNDNNGNPYSDVFWLAALVQSVGELEFGQQVVNTIFLFDSYQAYAVASFLVCLQSILSFQHLLLAGF